ncbi:MAG TPA: hypothetical protein VIS99_03085 [Terrimicrobiaceae bacterium]
MNPTVFTQCIVTGATQADELVWTYSEGRDFLTRGGVTQDWLDAVWSARSQLGLPPRKLPTTVNGVNNIYPKRATGATIYGTF